MKNLRINLIGIFVACMSLVACSGDDGAEGPAGPAGANGNANVENYTFTVVQADWTSGVANLSIPSLTETKSNNSQVGVYYSTSALGTDSIAWRALPYRFLAQLGQTIQFVTFQYIVNPGNIQVTSQAENGQNISWANPFSFRVVVIPSNAIVEDVDINNFEEVRQVYGLREEDF